MARPKKITQEENLKSLIIKLLSKGLYIEEVASILNLNKDTIYDWRKTDKEFADAVKENQHASNKNELRKNLNAVIKALIKRAKGFYYLETRKQYDGDGTLQNITKTKKYALPDTQAIQYILDQFDTEGADELGLTINVRYNNEL